MKFFAIWRWPKWTWTAIPLLLPVMYFLSAPILFVIAVGVLHPDRPNLGNALLRYCAPARWCAQHCKPLGMVFDWECDQMNPVVSRSRQFLY